MFVAESDLELLILLPSLLECLDYSLHYQGMDMVGVEASTSWC